MDEKITKKKVVIIVIVVVTASVLFGFFIDNLFNKAEDNLATMQAETEKEEDSEQAGTEDENTAETDTEDVLAKQAEEVGVTKEELQEYFDSSNGHYPEGTEGEVEIFDEEGHHDQKVGNYSITYDGSYASYGNISIPSENIDIDMVVYDDGNKDDVKGYFIAYPFFDGINQRPSSIVNAQRALSELIPENGKNSYDWEETTKFYIRKYSTYDTDQSCAIVNYTLVPKQTTEDNVYQLTFMASKSNDKTTVISEESFNSIIDPIKNDIKDSTLIHINYKDLREDLVNIAFFESADDDDDSGLRALKNANYAYLMRVYGTIDLDSLSDEQKKELEWKYNDYEGYKEYMYYEKGIDLDAENSSSED